MKKIIVKPRHHPNADKILEGNRSCPICGEFMESKITYRVPVDVCPAHGIWLDKGDLEQILINVTLPKHRKHLEEIETLKKIIRRRLGH
jgi:Zn-finger nucleic acid-binding protein